MAYYGAWGGNNPRYGQDAGPRPPVQPAYTAGQQAYPTAPYPTYQWGGYPMQGGGPYYYYPYPIYPQQQYYSAGQDPAATYPYYNMGGLAGMRLPQVPPKIDPTMPAANMTNSTGGVGCEPGYNYFFPAEHTKIHVLKTGATPPWQLPPHFAQPFHAAHVPVGTTLAELLKGFGATNPVPKKNKCHEVVQGGNGKWYKGLCFTGDEKDAMKMTLRDLGWDKTRSGKPGEKPVVYLYITKD